MPSQNFSMEYESKYELKVQNIKLKSENDRLRAENERLRDAANSLIEALPEIAFDLGIGWTNLGTIKRRRNNMIKALNEREDAEVTK